MRLGQVGYLRNQRFVEVIYTPVAPVTHVLQPSPDGTVVLDFFPDVEAELTVTGVDAASLGVRAAAVRADPLFEPVYRDAFVNYEEGKAFRTPQYQLVGSSMLSPFAAAATPVYRLFLRDRGIYRLSYDYLLNPTTGVAPGLAGVDPGTFKLLNHGVEVPIRVVTAVQGTFSPGDYVEFYGEGMLGEPPLKLNFDFDTIGQPLTQDIYQANDLTDENVYFLFGEPGTRARIPDLSATVNGFPQVSSFAETVHREFDNRFVPNGSDDPFFQDPFLFSNSGTFSPDPNAPNCGYVNPAPGVTALTNYLGPGFASGSPHYCQACDLALPSVLAVPDPATVRVRMRGSSFENGVDPDHMTVVQVGTTASDSSTLCWDGEILPVQTVVVPQTVLSGGAGVYIAQPGLAATTKNESLILDWIEVDYERELRLAGGGLIAHLPNGDATYQVKGFPTSVGADQVVYDLSRTVSGSSVPSPRHVTGATLSGMAGDFSLTFSLAQDATLPQGTKRVLAAAGTGGFLQPLRAEEVLDDDLTDTANEADMIVITAPGVVDTSPSSAFMTYMNHRGLDSGLTVRLVMIQDIYDQFSDGIFTPEAIRSFLEYAFTNWVGLSGTAAPPSYVMLVGDASLDYKNNLNLTGPAGWVEQVPTFIMYQPGPVLDYYASDTYIAAFHGGDQLPDIHLGRVPVRNITESETVFQKLLDYDVNPPTGSWRAHALYLADRGNNLAETNDFESTQTAIADGYLTAPFTNSKQFYDDPNYGDGTDPAAWRSDYVAAADAGAALTSYLGHGSFSLWGLDALLTGSQVSLLSQTQKPTFLLNENCLAGGFHALGADSLGEAFVKAPASGAVAVFAPAGLSFATVTGPINNVLYSDMFGPTKERRFGNLMTNVRLGLSFSVTDMQAYTLLGDPAQRFILPAPRPPRNFAAISGLDAQVELTWDPSPDPNVLTRIYRAVFPNSTYTLLNPSGAAGTSYTDTTAINGKPYFYKAVSVDPTLTFEGGLSNLNSTCNLFDPPSSGADCVWAIPLNPNPPAIPSNFDVRNPGLGDRLAVSWDSTSEPDILKYTISYGTTLGGPYPMTREISAPATGGDVSGLASGTTYYMVATATNTSGLTSAPTPERSGIPFPYEGINAPQIISDLEVIRSAIAPDSIELNWTAPTTDIYGGPVALASFSIYRDSTPLFVPSSANRLVTINDPSAVSYTDPGAFVAPSDYYYLVTATDTRGFSSGASLQLPAGISSLDVSVSGPNLTLNWPPVATDIDGKPTYVDHYVVYSDIMPVDRASLDAKVPTASSLPGPPFVTPVPPGSMMYYSVIVVDVRGNRSPY